MKKKVYLYGLRFSANLILLLASISVSQVVTVFPIINTYERMLLTQESDGTIKSIYK